MHTLERQKSKAADEAERLRATSATQQSQVESQNAVVQMGAALMGVAGHRPTLTNARRGARDVEKGGAAQQGWETYPASRGTCLSKQCTDFERNTSRQCGRAPGQASG